MLKQISIVLACTVIIFPVFAQSQSQENLTYVQNAQKMLNQSTAQAKKQYEKTYPKPSAPVISGPMQSATTSSVPPPPKEPPKENSAMNAANNKSYNYNNPSVQVAKPAPDVAVSGGNKNSPPAQNIFLPPGANNSNNQSAPNPYG